MFESSKFENPASNPTVISGQGRIWKRKQIPAGAGAGYDIQCNPIKNAT